MLRRRPSPAHPWPPPPHTHTTHNFPAPPPCPPQVQFSLLDRRPLNGMLQYCQANGIKLFSYGSVGGGLLSDKYAEEPKAGLFGEPSLFGLGSRGNTLVSDCVYAVLAVCCFSLYAVVCVRACAACACACVWGGWGVGGAGVCVCAIACTHSKTGGREAQCAHGGCLHARLWYGVRGRRAGA